MIIEDNLHILLHTGEMNRQTKAQKALVYTAATITQFLDMASI